MEQSLYEKIGRQEVLIEALKRQLTEVSGLLSRFISGEESPNDWAITPEGQLSRKTPTPATVAEKLPKPAKTGRKKRK